MPLLTPLQAHQTSVFRASFCACVLRIVDSMSAAMLSSAGTADTPGQAVGIDDLIQQIVKCVPVQPAPPSGPFKFAIDHCFAIRGQGTILTGTALSGVAKVGDTLELPELKVICHTACCPHGHYSPTDSKAVGFRPFMAFRVQLQ